MVLHGGGVLFGWPATRRILELIYPGADSPPGFESRDQAWAGAFLIIGAVLIIWTVGRLIRRRPVVRGGAAGLDLSLGGPLRRAVSIPWSVVSEISAGVASDDSGTFPTLRIRIDDPGLFAFRPWGARWEEDGLLSILTAEWDSDPEEVAARLLEVQASQVGALQGESDAQQRCLEVGEESALPEETPDLAEDAAAVGPVEDGPG